eukprot:tig00001477_g8901.t1
MAFVAALPLTASVAGPSVSQSTASICRKPAAASRIETSRSSFIGRPVFSHAAPARRQASFSFSRVQVLAKGAEEVSDAAFKDVVLDSSLPVLVDFWAPWCGPCRMVAPVVDEIADEYDGRLKVVKLNTDENPKVATEYGIRSIPSIMIFKNGQRVDTVVGAVPKATLESTIGKYLD